MEVLAERWELNTGEMTAKSKFNLHCRILESARNLRTRNQGRWGWCMRLERILCSFYFYIVIKSFYYPLQAGIYPFFILAGCRMFTLWRNWTRKALNLATPGIADHEGEARHWNLEDLVKVYGEILSSLLLLHMDLTISFCMYPS